MHIANMAAYLGAGLAVGLGAIGSGWGIGNAVVGAAGGIARQPSQQFPLFRSMLINQAFGSNASIFALIIGILLWRIGGSQQLEAPDSLAQAAAYLGAGLAVGIGALGSGVGSGLIAQESLEAIARCPSAQNRISLYMFIGQAWCQTPCVFAFVISILLLFVIGDFNQLDYYANIVSSGKLLGMGICMGAGAIGPAIGIAFVGAKVSESTAVYALVISLLLMAAE
jgi:F0F1-type ATP synthase membrane subunit c/vacuolar-type H+-ATPase subunit K